MYRSIFTFFLAILLSQAFAQLSPAVAYGDQISEPLLRENLTILASDAMEGRYTGKRGQKMAAAFISAHFEELNLVPPVNGSYYQPFEMYAVAPGNSYVKAGDLTFTSYDGIAYPGGLESDQEISLPLVFIGKGQKEDLTGIDINGKAVLVLSGIDEVQPAVDAIREKGSTAIFLVSTDTANFRTARAKIQREGRRARLSFQKPEIGKGNDATFYINQTVAEKLMGTTMKKLSEAAADPKKNKLKKIKQGRVSYKTDMEVRTVKTENVLGYLEGTDKKDELIVITAHYDHHGKRPTGEGDVVMNGADDDGSGTVAVMELARIFTKAAFEGHRPRRSMLFMTVTAEEIGLWGSKYYTSNPVYPLANTIVNLNIDMIGRSDAQHKDSADYVYVIGADKLSKELHNLNEEQNRMHTKLRFDYIYNDETHPDRLYYRSDHWNFAQKNIPIIFYFDGIHEDYHKVTDEVDRINFPLLRKRTQIVFYTAWEIANREQTIRPDKK
jgi:hypothetical protein